MPLLGTPKQQPPLAGLEKGELFALACSLYRDGATSEAYLIFSGLKRYGDSPALLTNLGLCLIKAGEWSEAVNHLEQALRLLKSPMQGRQPQNNIYKRLQEQEKDESGYLMSLPANADKYAPEYAQTSVKRLLVDCWAELGAGEKVRALAGQLAPFGYKNVAIALQKIENSGSKQ